MQMLSFSDHVATPLMTVSTVVFLALEVFSLMVFFLVISQYKRVVFKHQLLPRAIQHTLEKEPEKGRSIMLQIYIALTIFITLCTALLFWFQPHLL